MGAITGANAGSKLVDQLSKQPFQGCFGVASESGMNCGCLNYRTSRSGQPSESFTERHLPDRARIFAARTYPADRAEMFSDLVEIAPACECHQPGFVDRTFSP